MKSNIIKLKSDVTPLSAPVIDKSTITKEKVDSSEKKKSYLPKIDYEKRKKEKLYRDVTPLSAPVIDRSTINKEKVDSSEKRKKEKLTRDKIIKILNSDKMISSKKCPQDVTMEMLVDVMGNKSDVKYYVENNDKDALWEVYYNFLVEYVIM
jgi:hypothetical protein